uniref:Uncharacterized protein n=1 Tax=Chelonoidis abingdonii TaxID=106734 RepID=A0A8C0H520_CHEAB
MGVFRAALRGRQHGQPANHPGYLGQGGTIQVLQAGGPGLPEQGECRPALGWSTWPDKQRAGNTTPSYQSGGAVQAAGLAPEESVGQPLGSPFLWQSSQWPGDPACAALPVGDGRGGEPREPAEATGDGGVAPASARCQNTSLPRVPFSLRPALGGCYAWLCALLWLLGKPPGAVFVAICARQGDSSCRFLSVSDLFDRVIQHSDRLHSLSRALYEKNFLPNGNKLGKWTGKCHTSKMLTPNGKEYVQKIPSFSHSCPGPMTIYLSTVEM